MRIRSAVVSRAGRKPFWLFGIRGAGRGCFWLRAVEGRAGSVGPAAESVLRTMLPRWVVRTDAEFVSRSYTVITQGGYRMTLCRDSGFVQPKAEAAPAFAFFLEAAMRF